MSESRWKESKENIEHILDLVKHAKDDQIFLADYHKNLSFMKKHVLTDDRWRKFLRTLTYDEYDESMKNIHNSPTVLHVFFITRMFSNVVMKRAETLKIYVKVGVDDKDNVIVVSFHEPDFPDDRRFEQK